MRKSDVTIIGGGLAGLISSIQLAKKGLSVHLFEKKSYPFHRVCGEYVSREVLGYLYELGIDLKSYYPAEINRLLLTTKAGKQSVVSLPLGGVGISRYLLDFELYKRALEVGVEVFEQTAISEVSFDGFRFNLLTSAQERFHSRMVIGAHGKRSQIDRVLKRKFFAERSGFLGIKYHREGSFPPDVIALHIFPKGYCGISQIEEGKINMCYLVEGSVLKEHGSIEAVEAHLLKANKELEEFMHCSRSLYSRPLVISNVSFSNKPPVEQHILMVGDAAGLISPLCGNGMAMAIHSAKLASDCTIAFLEGKLNRKETEEAYTSLWKQQFSQRIRVGRALQWAFLSPTWSRATVPLLASFPRLGTQVIRKTHGSSIPFNTSLSL
ncbi:MAG: NAD(P)/FAD-dependent oxidoreductase [Bacteroidota bacterium]